MSILALLFKLHLRFFYVFIKMAKTKNKIVFFSRQSDDLSVDFEILSEEIKKRDNSIIIRWYCKTIKKTGPGLLGYYFHMFRQMYEIATSKVVVIDSYIPTVSMLGHKDTVYVIQLWHALGAIKKFSRQTLGMTGGREESTAKAFDMHKNYHKIISSSPQTTVFFSEAFGYTEDRFIESGLPRIDYLINNSTSIKYNVLKSYPQLDNGKTNILYAPTFRRTEKDGVLSLANAVDTKKYNLIVKPHAKQRTTVCSDKIISPKGFSAMELLTVTDVLITDYSAIAMEAAVLDVPTFYYLYDYEEYKETNGLNIDIAEVLPEAVFMNAEDYDKIIQSEDIDGDVYMREKFLPREMGFSTEKIVDLIMNKMD